MSFQEPGINSTNPTSSIKLIGSLNGVESQASKLTKSLALGFLMLFSVCGNTLIIACIVKNVNKRMRTVSNLLIFNTSIAYLLIAVVNVPILITSINLHKNSTSMFGGAFGIHICRMWNFVPFLSVTLATQSFAILAVDRFFAVFLPIRRLTHKTAYILIGFTWFNSLVFGGVYLYGSFTIDRHGTAVCGIQVDKTFHGIKGLVTFVWVEFTIFYLVPLIMATILYTTTIIRLWKPTMIHRGPFLSRYSDITNKNAIKMLVAVLALFTIAWIPTWVFTAICRGNASAFLQHPICKSRTFLFLKYFIGYSHGALAPFVYPFFSQNFKEGFKHCTPACLESAWNPGRSIRPVTRRTVVLELNNLGACVNETPNVAAVSIQWSCERHAEN